MLQIRVHAEHDGGGRNGRGRLYLYYGREECAMNVRQIRLGCAFNRAAGAVVPRGAGG